MPRIRRRQNFNGAPTGRTILLVGGILVAQLSAVAVNSVTSTSEPWPLGLEYVRHRPFAWSAGLTAVLALLTVVSSRMEANRAVHLARATADEMLLLQLAEITNRLGGLDRMLSWCRRQLGQVLDETSSPIAHEAMETVGRLHAAIGASRSALRPSIERTLGHLEQDGGREYGAIPRVRRTSRPEIDQPVVNLIDQREQQQRGTLAIVADWVRFVTGQLQDVGYELRDMTIDLEGARDLMTRLPADRTLEYSAITELIDVSRHWLVDVDTAAALLTQYLDSIGIPPDWAVT